MVKNTKPFIRVNSKGKNEYFCRDCDMYILPSLFSASSMKRNIRICSKCKYKRQIGDKENYKLKRLSRSLYMRERYKGVKRVKCLTLNDLMDVLKRFNVSVSDTSNIAICREDENKPFHKDTNCTVLNKEEQNEKSRAFYNKQQPSSKVLRTKKTVKTNFWVRYKE